MMLASWLGYRWEAEGLVFEKKTAEVINVRWVEMRNQSESQADNLDI